MTIQDIQSNEDLRRREFPVVKSKIFLSHAAVCPLPSRVAEAVRRCASASETGDQEKAFFPHAISRSRELSAKLLGCDAAEIALVGPTSLGLGLVSAGLKFKLGDNVVVYFDDYPSNVYPWMSWAEQGVEIRRVQTSELGLITLDDVLAQVDSRTRFVSLASCHFIGGYRIDIDAIGEALHDRGILFCVDGIQTLGAFPTSIRHVDFLAADAHKWMLGPCAAGLFYVSRRAQEYLKPALLGWHNVRCPDFIAQAEMIYRPGARRYEPGTHNLLGLAGMSAAIELLLEIGIENIGVELLRKRAILVSGLLEQGWNVLHRDLDHKTASGIVSFWREDRDMASLWEHLSKQNISSTLRVDRSGRKFIRLSPHFYNIDDELHQLLTLLR